MYLYLCVYMRMYNINKYKEKRNNRKNNKSLYKEDNIKNVNHTFFFKKIKK